VRAQVSPLLAAQLTLLLGELARVADALAVGARRPLARVRVDWRRAARTARLDLAVGVRRRETAGAGVRLGGWLFEEGPIRLWPLKLFLAAVRLLRLRLRLLLPLGVLLRRRRPTHALRRHLPVVLLRAIL